MGRLHEWLLRQGTERGSENIGIEIAFIKWSKSSEKK